MEFDFPPPSQLLSIVNPDAMHVVQFSRLLWRAVGQSAFQIPGQHCQPRASRAAPSRWIAGIARVSFRAWSPILVSTKHATERCPLAGPRMATNWLRSLGMSLGMCSAKHACIRGKLMRGISPGLSVLIYKQSAQREAEVITLYRVAEDRKWWCRTLLLCSNDVRLRSGSQQSKVNQQYALRCDSSALVGGPRGKGTHGSELQCCNACLLPSSPRCRPDTQGPGIRGTWCECVPVLFATYVSCGLIYLWMLRSTCARYVCLLGA
jgi:hypothetical protein